MSTKTVNSCKSPDYSRPSTKRSICAQQFRSCNRRQPMIFVVWQPNNRALEARVWLNMQTGQLIWNQFPCFAAFLGVQVHVETHLLLAILYYLWTSSHHRLSHNANASTFRIEVKISYFFVVRKMSTRSKMATVNCIFAPKHKCTWKFQK